MFHLDRLCNNDLMKKILRRTRGSRSAVDGRSLSGLEAGVPPPRDPFITLVASWVRAQDLLRPGDRVLAAVSGGADSLALLWVLWSLRLELSLAELAVASLDHGLRGADGRADLAFVRDAAKSLDLAFYGDTLAPGALAAGRGLSIEEAARRARYDFLGRVARAWGAGLSGPVRVAVGHTAGDQAETVLMRIIEGTGLSGLGGMPVLREEDGWILVRPLLGITRDETHDYCRRLGLSPREDPMNADLRFRRGLVRTRILPALREYNPRVEEALLRLADQARQAGSGWGPAADGSGPDSLLRCGRLHSCGESPTGIQAPQVDLPKGERPFSGLDVAGGRVVFVARSKLAGLDDDARRRLVRSAVSQLAGETRLRDLGYEGARRAARAAVHLAVGGRMNLPGRVVMETGYRYVFFACVVGDLEAVPGSPPDTGGVSAGPPPATADIISSFSAGARESRPLRALLTVPGRTEVDELGWVFDTGLVLAVGEEAGTGGDGARGSADFNPAKVEFPLAVRTRREGDTFHPAGLGAPGVGVSKKLKTFFISIKLPRGERERWPLVVDARDRIIWVVGRRADERFVGATGQEVLRISAIRQAREEGEAL
jgi:tRNA(Ile)-lysidine synthase